MEDGRWKITGSGSGSYGVLGWDQNGRCCLVADHLLKKLDLLFAKECSFGRCLLLAVGHHDRLRTLEKVLPIQFMTCNGEMRIVCCSKAVWNCDFRGIFFGSHSGGWAVFLHKRGDGIRVAEPEKGNLRFRFYRSDTIKNYREENSIKNFREENSIFLVIILLHIGGVI